MREMPEERWRAFLTESPRTAKLAVVKSDGSPHVSPIWIALDEQGRIVFNTGRNSVKGRSIRRDPRVTLCVDDDRPPYAFVIVEGTAVTSEDPHELVDVATAIGGRYMGADRAEEFGRRNGVPGELVVRVTPLRVIAREGVSD